MVETLKILVDFYFPRKNTVARKSEWFGGRYLFQRNESWQYIITTYLNFLLL